VVQLLKNTCIALNFCELHQGSIPFQRASFSDEKSHLEIQVALHLQEKPNKFL